MSSNDLVYRSNFEWRGGHGDTLACAKPGDDVCPGGFARQLKYGSSGVIYREHVRARANAAAQFLPAGKRYESKHAEPTQDNSRKSERKPSAWTAERIAALPRTSGALTRIGDTIEQKECVSRLTGVTRTEYTVPCQCSCGAVIHPQVSTWKSTSRPKSCRACMPLHRSAAKPFTDKGYAHARELVAREKEKAA